ncbi:MAG: DUF3040 domain-containing protein [Egibacteraceae bacterium]
MPLDDRERQILADIEAHLREDSRFTRAVGTATVTLQARRQLKLAAVGFVLGVLLLFGIVVHIAWGLAGFAIMLASAVYGGSMIKRLGQQDAVPGVGGQLRGGVRRYLNGHPPHE